MFLKIWPISVFPFEKHKKTQKFALIFYIWPVRRQNKHFFLLYCSFLSDIGWKSEFCASRMKHIEIFWQKMESWTEKCHLKSTKNQLCWELFQKKSALKQRSWALILLLLKNGFYSTDQSWISALLRFSVNEQRWIRTETALLSADNFWTRGDQCWNSVTSQTGIL